MADLQSIGNKANKPQPLRRALDGVNVQYRQEGGPAAPMAGGLGPGNRSMLAGVEKGSPNVVSILDPEAFRKNADQLATHEDTHVWQNNLPPSIQAKIPPDNPSDPYNYGGTQGIKSLLAKGGTIADMPREQAAAAMQYGQANGMPEPYNQLAHTMDKVPLSQIEMTDPMAKTLNMHPRAPQVPPSSVPGMNFANTIYQPGEPAPGDDSLLPPDMQPMVAAAHAAPTLNPLAQPLAETRQRLQRVDMQQARPWGFAGAPPSAEFPNGLAPNHPGTWGKIAHVLSVAGNIAGDIVAPNIMANIPGTELNMQAQHNGLTHQLEGLTQQQSENEARDASTQATQLANANEPQRAADTHNLSVAQQGNLESESYARTHPIPQNEFQLWRQQNPNGTEQQYEAEKQHPLSEQDAASRNAVWDSIADKYHLPKGQFKAGMSAADATALAASLNNVIGRNQGAEKIIIQGQNANNAATKARDAETNKEYNAAQKDLSAQFSAANLQSDALTQARQELGSGAVGQAVGTIKTLVGLAGGKGTGVRITQAELNALANARGIKGSFEGYINGLEGKGNLAPEQLAQMQQLLTDIEGRIQQKMAVQDTYLDRLSNATSTQEIRQIQSEYRKELLHGGQQQGAGGEAPPPGAKVRDYTSLGGGK